MDESYFGGVGKRSRGVAVEVVVFCILKRGGKILSKVVGDTKTTTLLPIITRKIAPDARVSQVIIVAITLFRCGDFHHEKINPIFSERI